MSEETPTPTGQEADVKDFLKQSNAGTVEKPVPDAPPGAPLQVSPETLEALKKSGSVVGFQPGPSIGEPIPEAAKRVEVPQEAGLAAALQDVEPRLSWEVKNPVLGKIQITELERDLFIKAMFNDVALEWQIRVQPEWDPILVRSLNDFETDAIYRAVSMDQKEEIERLGTAAPTMSLLSQLNTRVQGYAVCMHIVEIPGKSFPVVRFEGDNLPTLDDAAQQIRDRHKKLFQNMHPPRYNLLLNAIRIFDIKLNYCNTALANGDFIKPVVIA
jgi:hypothetical protein